MKLKIRELSRISGVSPATISRMLKDPNSVKVSTRNKINDILKNNGIDNYFSMNAIKRVILIIPDLSNSFYIDMFNGIISVVQKSDIPFEIYLTNESIEEETKIFSRIENDKDIGVIWVPASAKRDKLPYNKNSNIVSLVDRDLEFEDIYIKNLSNNFSAAKKATDLLIEGGAKNPIIITGSLNLSNAQERKDGFLESIKSHNLDNGMERVYYGDFNNSDSGYYIIKKLVEENIKFDSILAANQIVAIGILKALKELKLSIPEDVSIISFDKVVNLYSENQNISEVVFPAFDIGVNATEVLLEQQSFNMSKQIYNFSAQFNLRGSEKKL
ncbi:LacI family transcriptional regulator [Brachyspira pilosicoli]|uniref:LacI family transcriptional regulator n=1 Tax=Brachyspira pilosicoli TaxID=52584 RepID=A0AAJ6K8K5_BRAPL|nr:LacI family DNA-binding transcriptional regulator [Brachyspira pilosicoli]PLV61490.1 LacI family transcription regulator [Brachyspira pilosicoli SP16]WIH81931.1 LacI family transcriptional regulator [Brachyspira pilosicoli]WIH84016.1 LacI family transcriptional regulator [Brachyspira pilosicoli]WIH86420.1 LacI family transcriptional regulator [Brachyspira pilosicoli]WIH88599.1 LacI family transcriptional regulator [Brachyspira pilosicoli]